MHRLLQRQLKEHLNLDGGAADLASLSAPMRALLDAVNEAYAEFDADRILSERSLEITSHQVSEHNRELLIKNAELEIARQTMQSARDQLEMHVSERTAELRHLNALLLVDIGERKKAQAALRESEERFSLAMRGANDGLWDWDLKQNRCYFSSRWKGMLGFEESEIGTHPDEWFGRVHAEEREEVKAAVAAHLEGQTPHFEVEHRMLHKDGSYRWMLARGIGLRQSSGRAYRVAGSQTDTTTRKTAEEQLLRDALHDGLTGLPNRALFLDRLERAIARTKRNPDYGFAVLFLDLDRFKIVNDSLGHLVGDQLLISFAQRLGACLRPADTLARLGGDEFCVLLEDIRDVHAATLVADRIHQSLQTPIQVDGHEVFTTASIGIATSATAYERPQELLRDADTAMYRAKALGKARHQVFDTAMHARAVKLLRIENDLRRAVERSELEVHFQPIISLRTLTISSLEALVRWRHPERGLIPPGDFIPVAEETGLIAPIGRFVLIESCRQAVVWHRMFSEQERVGVSVNLSARQFTQPDLVEQIEAVLRETGLPARYLTVEITESVIMDNAESAAHMLKRLKALEIQVNIDDFGTGYSSLGYLHRFPADTMKIDRSFISGAAADNEEIVRTIVALAHNLKMKVTAEGIETAEQLMHLQRLGCEYAQGYYFSKPLDAPSITRLLASRPNWGPPGRSCA